MDKLVTLSKDMQDECYLTEDDEEFLEALDEFIDEASAVLFNLKILKEIYEA